MTVESACCRIRDAPTIRPRIRTGGPTARGLLKTSHQQRLNPANRGSRSFAIPQVMTSCGLYLTRRPETFRRLVMLLLVSPLQKEFPAVARMLELIAATMLLVHASGCGYTRSWWAPQGTIKQRQMEASIFDPYAEPDVGPEVVGSRPRDFQKPFAEPVRNSRPANAGWGR